MRRVLIGGVLLLAWCLGGCAISAQDEVATDNSAVTLDLLFERDGCAVYRFKDAGHYVYFVRCGDVTTLNWRWSESCGKGCERKVPHVVVQRQ